MVDHVVDGGMVGAPTWLIARCDKFSPATSAGCQVVGPGILEVQPYSWNGRRASIARCCRGGQAGRWRGEWSAHCTSAAEDDHLLVHRVIDCAMAATGLWTDGS